MTKGSGAAAPDRRGAGRRLALAGAAALVAGALLVTAAGGRFRVWAYQLLWYPYLLLLDGALAWADGRFALAARPRFAVSLLLWSVPVWLLFEAFNFRLANWFYVNVPPERAVRWPGYVLAFATVLPAVYLPYRWIRFLAPAGRRPSRRGFAVTPGLRGGLVAAGVICLALIFLRPRWFYPLTWGAVVLIVEPWNHRRAPEASLLGDLAEGRYGRLAALLGAGLLAGVAWETMNAVAGARWIYTVPGLEGWKIFEMPVPGFLGFPPFALECFVVYRALVNLGVAVPGWNPGRPGLEPSGAKEAGGPPSGIRPARVAVAAVAAALFSALVLEGVDRRTVASSVPRLEALPGVDAAGAATLRRTGFREVAEVAGSETAVLARWLGLAPEQAARTIRVAALAGLRGLGIPAARTLVDAGIDGPCALEAAGVGDLVDLLRPTGAVHAAPAARVRVWKRAAREACARSRRGEDRARGEDPARRGEEG